MLVHGERDRFVSRRIREEGVWEPYETSLVLAMLRPGDVFVDVGANIGYFTILAASAVGAQGMVFAFEPDPAIGERHRAGYGERFGIEPEAFPAG